MLDEVDSAIILEEVDETFSHKAEYTLSQRQIRNWRTHHLTILVISLAAIGLSFIFEIKESGSIGLIGTNKIEFPGTCGSRNLFGIECPGCGMTRSFVCLANGDLTASLRYHRLGWLMAIACLAQVPFRLYAIRVLKRGIVEHRISLWIGRGVLLALLFNWLLGHF